MVKVLLFSGCHVAVCDAISDSDTNFFSYQIIPYVFLYCLSSISTGVFEGDYDRTMIVKGVFTLQFLAKRRK